MCGYETVKYRCRIKLYTHKPCIASRLQALRSHQPDKYESAPMTTRKKNPFNGADDGGLRERAETVDRKQDRTKTRTETKRNRSRKTTTQNETKTKPEKTRRDDLGEPGRN